MALFTPVNQKRLTNVSTVRLTKGGKRFELACYNNKVLSFRAGVETDLGEVLQSDFVFSNVGKGEFAKADNLKKAFGTTDFKEVAKVILEKGDIQVSAKERAAASEAMLRDIATIVSSKCVNPQSGRPYPVTTILSAMRDELHFSVAATRGAKQQALEVLRKLQSIGLPIARARMHVRVHLPTAQAPPTAPAAGAAAGAELVLGVGPGAEVAAALAALGAILRKPAAAASDAASAATASASAETASGAAIAAGAEAGFAKAAELAAGTASLDFHIEPDSFKV